MAGGSSRRKGFEVNRMKSRKPVLIAPMTPSTRAIIASGS